MNENGYCVSDDELKKEIKLSQKKESGDTFCKKCNGLISTSILAHAKQLIPYSLMYVRVCNKCATKKDWDTAEKKVKTMHDKYHYGVAPSEFKLIRLQVEKKGGRK